MNEIDEIVERIKKNKSVEGLIICNTRCEVIKTTYKGDKKPEGDRLIANITELISKAQICLRSINATVT